MLFIYGTRLRPAGPGCQPKPFVKIIKTNEVRVDGVWSEIAYDHELTEDEVERFEMIYLRTEPLLKTWRVNYKTIRYRVETTDVTGLRNVIKFDGHQHDAAWDEFRLTADDSTTHLIQAALYIDVADYEGDVSRLRLRVAAFVGSET